MKLLPTGIIFYLRQREDVHEDMFEPVSKSQWRLLREMSPGKMTNSYHKYCERCNSAYLDELKTRKECKVELTSIQWHLRELDGTQKKIISIQEDDGFINWATDKDINNVSEILKLKE